MRLRWTAGALRDLENIVDHLFDKTPQHAPRLTRSIYEAVAALRTFPSRGRAGKKAGTREFVMASLPYVVVSSRRRFSPRGENSARRAAVAGVISEGMAG